LEAERRTGLSLTQKQEPGQIGTRGRYKGEPLPYGAASLEASEAMLWQERWSLLLGQLAEHIETFRACGAEDVHLSHGYFYEGQCNLEFSPEALRQVADLGIPFCISCYMVPDWTEPAV